MTITLYPPAESVFFTINGFEVRFYGIILAISLILGSELVYFLLSKRISKQAAENFLDFEPLIIIFSVIGARLFYVIGAYSFYLKHPAEILMIHHGGLSIWGAIFFGLLALKFCTKRKKVDFLAYCDIVTLVMPLCQAIGRWGNFFNQEAFGLPSNSFFKLYVDLKYRPSEFINVKYFHPTFLYECIFDLLLFAILMFLYFKFKNLKTGTITLFYLIFYSIIRIFVESLRIDSVLDIADIPIAQLICSMVLLVCAFFLLKLYAKK